MNRRQKLKKLKRENEFLLKIINHTDDMKAVYRSYNEPFRVFHTYNDFKQYRIVKDFAVPNKLEGDALRTFMAEQIAKELQPFIENNMQLEDYGDESALEFRGRKEVKAIFNLWVEGVRNES